MYAFGADPAGPEGRRRSLAHDSLSINHPRQNDTSGHALRKQGSKDDMCLPSNSSSNFQRGRTRRLTIGGDSRSSIDRVVGYKRPKKDHHFGQGCPGHTDKPNLTQYHQRRLTVAYDMPCTPLRSRDDFRGEKQRQRSTNDGRMYQRHEDNITKASLHPKDARIVYDDYNQRNHYVGGHQETVVRMHQVENSRQETSHTERSRINKIERALLNETNPKHVQIDYSAHQRRPSQQHSPASVAKTAKGRNAATVIKSQNAATARQMLNRTMCRVPRKVLVLQMYNKGEQTLPQKDTPCYVRSLKSSDSFPPTYLFQSFLLFLIFPVMGVFAIARAKQVIS